jgi:hypothetical protein
LNNLPIRRRLQGTLLFDHLLDEQSVGAFSRTKPVGYRLLPSFPLVDPAATMHYALLATPNQKAVQSMSGESNTLAGLRRKVPDDDPLIWKTSVPPRQRLPRFAENRYRGHAARRPPPMQAIYL